MLTRYLKIWCDIFDTDASRSMLPPLTPLVNPQKRMAAMQNCIASHRG